MLASELKKHTWPSRCAVLAFGVSNSNEINTSEFERERLRVDEYLQSGQVEKVVYFSSSNIYQRALTPYAKHKIIVEDMIRGSGKDFHIFRLPQVVGAVVNSTLVSFLVQKLVRDEIVTIYKSAKRNLIGVDDVACLVSDIVSRRIGVNTSQDIVGGRDVSVEDIVLEISNILQRRVRAEYVEGGAGVGMSFRFLAQYYPTHKVISEEKYWTDVLRKYVPLVAEKI